MRMLAVARAMLLALVRDRTALLMGFVVPVLFFLIMAEIFSSAADGELRLRVVIVDEINSEESGRLLAELRRQSALRLIEEGADRSQARELVRRGTADVGLIVRADGEPLSAASGFGPPPLLLLTDPSRAVTAEMLSGQLQRAWFTALPDAPLRNVVELIGTEFTDFTPLQQQEIEEGLAALRRAAAAGAQVGFSFEDLVEQDSVIGQTAALNHVAYYAGAIGFMFLLFAATQGALTLIDEHEAGILDRVATAPGGSAVLINGKFLFLCGQGIVQLSLIFGAAWLVHGVDLGGNFLPWLLITVACAVAAAGIGLALIALCATRARAQLLPVVVIVTLSAVGGSMVPRFFMPGWLQDLGWLTPNTWALEAYSGVFWRGASTPEVLLPCILLFAAGLLALLAAQLAGRRLVSD